MIKLSLILIGTGGHARSCIDVIDQQGQYQIAGLIGMPDEVKTQHLGYSVIGTDNDLPELTKTCQYALITVGQESTSPHPVMPASVSILIRHVSCVPSQAAVTSGRRRTMAVISVIFMADSLHRDS